MTGELKGKPRPMEPSKFRVAEQAVENVAHLMEKRNNIVVPH